MNQLRLEPHQLRRGLEIVLRPGQAVARGAVDAGRRETLQRRVDRGECVRLPRVELARE
jgi:hypothetical protein